MGGFLLAYVYGSSGSLELARWVVGTVMASHGHDDLPVADYERDSPAMEDTKEVSHDDAPGGVAESKELTAELDGGPMVPKRVKLALEVARDFEEYRRLREFRFLHMYSGPVDILSREVEAEAAKQRLRVKCVGLDKKVDDIDLATVRSHTVLRDEVRDGEWDATHAGFPCGSFSRARHNDVPGMPGPVRDGQNIYGLESNTPQQQDEADRGTMMATQAAWIMEEQVNTCKRRKVPPAATLENPPGDQKCGSAWQLPEIRIVMDNTRASVAQYNTCAFQSKSKVRWYKPGQFVGRLEGLDQIARICKCPSWVTHQSLVGKQCTEAAGEYPAELANIIAKNIVATWKRTLNLEFWRYKLAMKQDEVSELQKKWVVNEEKRTNNLSQKRTIHMAVERGEPMVDELPSSSTHPSKKQRKEEENFRSLGGMRNPTVTVSRMHLVKLVGQRMRTEWIQFLAQHPTAIEVAEMYGSNETKFDETVMAAWKEKLGALLRVEKLESGGLILKENFTFKSPLAADLWDAWGKETRDPDTALPGFIRRGAPLGMELEIPSSNGVFPAVDDTAEETGEPETEFEAIKGLLNYKSVQEQPQEAKLEIERNIKKGFVVRMSWSEVERRFGKGTCSRMALLLKEKPDGTTKRRIILDMRRSGGNSRARVRERIVLPRLGDVVQMVKNLKSREAELFDQLAAGGVDKVRLNYEVKQREFILVDLADAFCHFAVADEELRHCVTPDETSDGCLLWVAMLFGYRAAPLIMARLSAAIGRLLAGFMMPYEGQLQIYVDDLIIALQGGVLHRNVILSGLLYTMAAMGVQVSLGKGERGIRVTWIGAEIELWTAVISLTLPIKTKRELLEILKTWSTKGMISVKELRSTTGRLSWAAGVVPRIRWTVSIFYAVISAVEKEESDNKYREHEATGDKRLKRGLVHVKRLGFALPWLIKMLELDSVNLVRDEDYEDAEPTVGVITDASPKGVGAVLVKVKKDELIMYEAFEAEFTETEAKLLDVAWGEAESQSVVEAYAIYRAVKRWGATLKKRVLLIKSDSSVALHMLRKLASPSPSLNYIAAEISLLLEDLKIPRLVLHHIPGVLNVETDWLSRMHDRKARPASLDKVPIKTLEPLRVEQFQLKPPGALKAEEGGSVTYQSGVLTNLE